MIKPLEAHLHRVRRLHQRDQAQGFGAVELLFALQHKYPNASREWSWQYLFPSRKRAFSRQAGTEMRYRMSEATVQRAVKQLPHSYDIASRK